MVFGVVGIAGQHSRLGNFTLSSGCLLNTRSLAKNHEEEDRDEEQKFKSKQSKMLFCPKLMSTVPVQKALTT
jgi:hypothetical protein